MTINQNDFVNWKRDQVTQSIFGALQELRNQINLDLVDANLIMSEGYDKKAANLLGKREGIDLILEVTAEDVEDSDET